MRNLPKFFSRGCKQRMKTLTEDLMLENTSCAECRAIYAELTGDQSVNNTKITKEVDEWLKTIMHNLTPDLAEDLRVNNTSLMNSMNFWIFVRKFFRNLQSLTIVVNAPLVKKLVMSPCICQLQYRPDRSTISAKKWL